MNRRLGEIARLCVLVGTMTATGSAAAQPADVGGASEPAGDETVPPAAPAADTPATEPPAPSPEAEQPPIGNDEKRVLPDYDGRGEEPTTAGDVALWIPRGIFFPAYLVSEYVIRWPLGQLTSALDEHDVPGILSDFFTFGPGDSSGLVPSALIDFGFRPSIGLYFFTDDVLWDGNAIRSHLAFGGLDWYRGTLTLRHKIQEESADHHAQRMQLRAVYSHRPDWQFWGLGPLSSNDERSGYTAQRVDGTASFNGGFWRSSWLEVYAGVRDLDFKDQACCDEVPLSDRVAAGFYDFPPLYLDGYLIGRVGFNGALDTRERRNAFDGEGSDHVSPPGTGLKLGLRGELAGSLRDVPPPADMPNGTQQLRYLRYGASFGGYYDLYQQRTLGLQVMVDFVDPFADEGQIPFTELSTLGGNRPMRGFLQYRMLDRSSAVAQLEYRWPIWVSLDGTMHYAVGNVFAKHLENFDPALLRQSFGLGFRATGTRDHSFEFLIAGGTETFDEGSTLDSFRFVFGATSGF